MVCYCSLGNVLGADQLLSHLLLVLLCVLNEVHHAVRT